MAIVIRLTVDGVTTDMYYRDARGALVPVLGTAAAESVPVAQADGSVLWTPLDPSVTEGFGTEFGNSFGQD